MSATGAPALQTLRTARLLLRCPRPGDGARAHAAVVESLADLRVWSASLPWALDAPSVESSERFCVESARAFERGSAFTYLLEDGDSGALVGCASLLGGLPQPGRMELGFWCRSSCTRQGYMREAVEALLSLACGTLGSQAVEAWVDERNTACRALCLSVGMVEDGAIPEPISRPCEAHSGAAVRWVVHRALCRRTAERAGAAGHVGD